MPANMMMEPVGSSLKVTGSSRATVTEGLIPGRMPTSVPSSTPMPAKSRLAGWMATPSPCRRDWRTSIGNLSQQPLERADGQRERERLGEEQVDREREHRANGQQPHVH